MTDFTFVRTIGILYLFRLCLSASCIFIDFFFTRTVRNICRHLCAPYCAVDAVTGSLTIYLRGSGCKRLLLTNARRTVTPDRVIGRVDDCGVFPRLRTGTDLKNQHGVFNRFSRTDIDDGTIARSVDAGSEVGIGYGSFAAVKQCLCFFSSYGDVAGKRLTQMRLNI